ncbi:hypothetical protein C4580_01305 [Candidatus Woesearchaeota archaeon]|nr:MAG: hypothetical protein C4580_01305 [Candidatus Woesearchaeota archaeon]
MRAEFCINGGVTAHAHGVIARAGFVVEGAGDCGSGCWRLIKYGNADEKAKEEGSDEDARVH